MSYDSKRSSNMHKRERFQRQLSTQISKETNDLSLKYYPNERPPVFETINYINNLLEKSNHSWSDKVSSSFNQ